ncbi:MAG: GNAT family N-acetyltransferase [Rhodocyclaceae bacterium]|nr:GNAT family N-acetyltransferase [Rhodocyclaceae bacterium]
MNRLQLGVNLFIRRYAELTSDEVMSWNRLLLDNDDTRRAFMSPTYVAAVEATGGVVWVLIVYAGGTPVFILPIQRAHGMLGRFGIFEPAGGVMTDYFGAIAQEGESFAPQELIDASEGVIGAILFTHLDESQSRLGLSGGEFRTGLRIRLGDLPAEYWNNLRKVDKKLVYDTERREKKLIKEVGDLSFEWTSTRPDQDMTWLIESKKRQYSRAGRNHAPLFDDTNVALLRNLLAARDETCLGILSVLRCGDSIVAAHFGLQCREVLHVWFPVYEQKCASYSPGRILLRHMFQAATSHGITTFDRGEGDTQAKRDFANEEHRFARGLWLASGMRGLLAHLALRVAWRVDQLME